MKSPNLILKKHQQIADVIIIYLQQGNQYKTCIIYNYSFNETYSSYNRLKVEGGVVVLQKFISLFIILVFLLIGCSSKSSLAIEGAAENYLKEKGYKIVSKEDAIPMKFSKEDLSQVSSIQIWSVQNKEVEEYLDKIIQTVGFVVKNHPLEIAYNTKETKVTVFLFEGKVIGGTSSPSTEEPLRGGPHSLEGLTAEKIKEDFTKWEAEWNKNYGN